MYKQMEDTARGALVLGGGGPLGIAWEAGMLQGWAEAWAPGSAETAGLDVLLRGRIVGTSAGAIVGAHLAVHRSVQALFARQDEPMASDAPGPPKMVSFLAAYVKAKLLTRTVADLRRRMGRSARSQALAGEAAWVAAIAQTFAPAGDWPTASELVVTVIDAETGELHGWRAADGVPLAQAVAASCSVPCAFPLVHVRGRAYMDGGIGSPTNAALAGGCAHVVVLDPLGRMMGAAAPLEAETRALRAAGSRTLAIVPDQAVADAIGMHVLDASRRAETAGAGRQQGIRTAALVWEFLQQA